LNADNIRVVFKYAIILAFVVLVYYFLPKGSNFHFQFSKNEVWQYDDLFAPFSFPVLKTDDEIKQEKELLSSAYKPIFIKNSSVLERILLNINNSPEIYLIPHAGIPTISEADLKFVEDVLIDLYNTGIYNPDEIDNQFNSQIITIINENKNSSELFLENIFTVNDAKEYLKAKLLQDSFHSRYFIIQKIVEEVTPNLLYEKQLTAQNLKVLLNEILPTKGMIIEGEKIISKGMRITDEKYQELFSLKQTFEGKEKGELSKFLNDAGYLLLVLIIFFVFILYLSQADKNVFNTNKEVFLILTTISVFIIISSYVVKNNLFSIYLIPFCIVPILLISFFETRIAFISHLVVVGTVSIFVSDNFDFLFVQIIAGLSVVIAISRVRYISQFFISVLLVTAAYVFSYLGLHLLKVSEYSELDLLELRWFAGNFILTLLAYPLIYAYEKLFGKVSDLSLIELSDLNKKLLRELASKAPGTFQHSLQVANLTEAVLAKIGGNSLLAKVGCLYHDIGKMNAPLYFIENQKDINPYEKIVSEKEAAAIIIRHVSDGVKLAREHKLPREVINFIKTHHGTTRVEYFYRNFIKRNPEATNVENEFRYPGPKPTTKEMAIVMIADSIEAATRSLKDTSQESLEKLVDTLVDQKLSDNQFQNANITFKEIKIAKDIIKNSLRSIYHQRIEYPSEN